MPRRATWGERAPHYAALIAAARVRRVAEAVDHRPAEGPEVAVHGGRVRSLLDVDTAGRCERLNDAACLLGHLAVLGRLHPDRAEPVDRLARDLSTGSPANWTATPSPGARRR